MIYNNLSVLLQAGNDFFLHLIYWSKYGYLFYKSLPLWGIYSYNFDKIEIEGIYIYDSSIDKNIKTK